MATCWEVIFDRAPRRSVLSGAQLLAVPTNNATFDVTMSRQQLAIAKTRAVEHHRYVVVAGTTGISAVIAPTGMNWPTRASTNPPTDSPVRLETRLTPATRWGPAVQWLLVGAAVAAVIAPCKGAGAGCDILDAYLRVTIFEWRSAHPSRTGTPAHRL